MSSTISHINPTNAPWQNDLTESFTDPAALLRFLELDTELVPHIEKATKMFPFRVPQSYASRMEKGNFHDPLLRQVLPLESELEAKPGYSDNPVGDIEAIATAGILQKYDERALLLTTGACAINCRYCFRRNFSYNEAQLTRQQEQQTFNHLKNMPSIQEVILSGGDPLVLPDNRLQDLLEKLSSIPHIQRVRIHSRIPIVLPSRISDRLIRVLTQIRPTPVVVVHANHANEISVDVQQAIRLFRKAQIIVLNQSVLLRGVNDNLQALSRLSEILFASGVLPYYLHLLDKTNGAAHFDVEIDTALRLQEGLHRKLPGYLVPRFVREQTGAHYKLPLTERL